MSRERRNAARHSFCSGPQRGVTYCIEYWQSTGTGTVAALQTTVPVVVICTSSYYYSRRTVPGSGVGQLILPKGELDSNPHPPARVNEIWKWRGARPGRTVRGEHRKPKHIISVQLARKSDAHRRQPLANAISRHQPPSALIFIIHHHRSFPRYRTLCSTGRK